MSTPESDRGVSFSPETRFVESLSMFGGRRTSISFEEERQHAPHRFRKVPPPLRKDPSLMMFATHADARAAAERRKSLSPMSVATPSPPRREADDEERRRSAAALEAERRRSDALRESREALARESDELRASAAEARAEAAAALAAKDASLAAARIEVEALRSAVAASPPASPTPPSPSPASPTPPSPSPAERPANMSPAPRPRANLSPAPRPADASPWRRTWDAKRAAAPGGDDEVPPPSPSADALRATLTRDLARQMDEAVAREGDARRALERERRAAAEWRERFVSAEAKAAGLEREAASALAAARRAAPPAADFWSATRAANEAVASEIRRSAAGLQDAAATTRGDAEAAKSALAALEAERSARAALEREIAELRAAGDAAAAAAGALERELAELRAAGDARDELARALDAERTRSANLASRLEARGPAEPGALRRRVADLETLRAALSEQVDVEQKHSAEAARRLVVALRQVVQLRFQLLHSPTGARGAAAPFRSPARETSSLGGGAAPRETPAAARAAPPPSAPYSSRAAGEFRHDLFDNYDDDDLPPLPTPLREARAPPPADSSPSSRVSLSLSPDVSLSLTPEAARARETMLAGAARRAPLTARRAALAALLAAERAEMTPAPARSSDGARFAFDTPPEWPDDDDLGPAADG